MTLTGYAYVRCINNRKTFYFPEEPRQPDTILGLKLGQVYQVVPPLPNDDPQTVRVIDGTGEDYPYPISYFEPFIPLVNELASVSATVHLSPTLRQILQAEALAHQTTVSGLLRQWIDERLDLPIAT